MLTPVFIDDLPEASPGGDRRAQLYRLRRNRELIDLLVDDATAWLDRDCPVCGAAGQPQHFTMSPLPFHRCLSCNTIHAVRVPPQDQLDRLRLALLDDDRSDPASHYARRRFEFASMLNWVELTASRYGRPIRTVLDYRFDTHMPGFARAAAEEAGCRRWLHLPLVPGEAEQPSFADLRAAVAAETPDAVLVQAELDRAADPRALIGAIAEAMPPGGLVFLSSSCADGLEYEILGPRSPSFVPLDRLNLFSTVGLRRLATECGFEVLEISTPGRLDAVLLKAYFDERAASAMPFWSGFFRTANRDQLRDLQMLLQRSLRSGVMRLVLRRL